MPFNEERTNFGDINSQEESSQELILLGGLKNALERGENIVSAQKTFVNAGYSVKEVSAAAKKLSEEPKTSPTLVHQEEISQNNNKSKFWIWTAIWILVAAGIGAILYLFVL